MIHFAGKDNPKRFRVELLFLPILVISFYIGFGAVLIRGFGIDAVAATVVMDIVFGALCAAYVYKFEPFAQGDGKSVSGVRMKYMMWVMLVLVWIFGQITSSYILNTMGDAKFEAYQSTLNGETALWLSVLLTVVFAPFCEEMMLRGVVQDMWSRINPWFGLFGSALVFSFMHGTAVHLPSTFLMGLMASVVYASTSNIWYSVLIHVGYNGAASFLGKVSLPSILFEPYVFLAADVLLVAWMIFEYRRSLRARKEVSHGEEEEKAVKIGGEETDD